MIPQLESPPRVRVEWLIAGTRVALAVGTLLAVTIEPIHSQGQAYLLGWYVVYSLAVLALVWTPARFARGWDIAVHFGDLAVFTLWTIFPEGLGSSFIVYFSFLVICATLRWQIRGTVWTSCIAIAAYVSVNLSVASIQHLQIRPSVFAARTVYLLLIAALIGYLGTHQRRFQYEISRLASWPRRMPGSPTNLVAEIIRQSSEFLESPRTVLVWEEPGEAWVNMAWSTDDEVFWTREPEGTYGAFVLPALEGKSFQAADAAHENGRVLSLTSSGFRRRECRPINEALRARFNMRAVQSWPLDGGLIRGRMFCLDKVRMRLDDLILGEVVAWLAMSRLESLYLQGRLREAAALDERVRIARDLHDSLLQSQAGNALQLLAARRLLERDPEAAKERLAEVQNQLERDELEVRSFITRLRPANRPVSTPTMSLVERLEELRDRVQRQWEIRVNLQLDSTDDLPDDILEGVYRLAQEGIVNAARHADASVIHVTLIVTDDALRLRISDDGRGFPFQGTFDLTALNKMNDGPLTLKERVIELGGGLTLTSTETGTDLYITLPYAHVSR